MSKFRRSFRRSWKFIAIWMGLIALVLTQKFRDLCSGSQENLCKDTSAAISSIGVFLGNYASYLLAAAVGLLLIKLVLHIANREDKTIPGFKNYPWKYDKEVIKLTGRVEKVLHNRWQEKLKRKFTDIYRTITNNNDQTYRNLHQRFLISSPQLRKGELMLIEHNLKFGKISLSKGTWLSIQGEYIHRRSKRHGRFGNSFTFYGRIHSTYEPKGYIRPLGKKAAVLSSTTVEVVSRNNDSNS